jgi:hypothetical protein
LTMGSTVNPDFLADLLLKSQAARNQINDELDYILIIGFSGKNPDTKDRLLQQNWSRTWECERDQGYSLCYSPERLTASDLR